MKRSNTTILLRVAWSAALLVLLCSVVPVSWLGSVSMETSSSFPMRYLSYEDYTFRSLKIFVMATSIPQLYRKMAMSLSPNPSPLSSRTRDSARHRDNRVLLKRRNSPSEVSGWLQASQPGLPIGGTCTRATSLRHKNYSSVWGRKGPLVLCCQKHPVFLERRHAGVVRLLGRVKAGIKVAFRNQQDVFTDNADCSDRSNKCHQAPLPDEHCGSVPVWDAMTSKRFSRPEFGLSRGLITPSIEYHRKNCVTGITPASSVVNQVAQTVSRNSVSAFPTQSSQAFDSWTSSTDTRGHDARLQGNDSRGSHQFLPSHGIRGRLAGANRCVLLTIGLRRAETDRRSSARTKPATRTGKLPGLLHRAASTENNRSSERSWGNTIGNSVAYGGKPPGVGSGLWAFGTALNRFRKQTRMLSALCKQLEPRITEDPKKSEYAVISIPLEFAVHKSAYDAICNFPVFFSRLERLVLQSVTFVGTSIGLAIALPKLIRYYGGFKWNIIPPVIILLAPFMVSVLRG
eukprot:GHVQ01029216.1.p1 GENE.GHVQ01029216.1~~GHVQ01029216.1.p1  ORF type:complete len:515 (-),score=20.28 GHVQ01029216.1:190-1734(-)